MKKKLLTALFILLAILSAITWASRYMDMKRQEDRAEQRRDYERRLQIREDLKVDDKLFTPDEIVEQPASTDANEPQKAVKDIPITLSPYLRFIGHVHIDSGERLMGRSPSIRSDNQQLAMFVKSRDGTLRLDVSDIEYVTNRDVHQRSGLTREAGIDLHSKQSLALETTDVSALNGLTHLPDGNWFWLTGKIYQRLRFYRAAEGGVQTCWHKWSGSSSDLPEKTCLNPSLEKQEVYNFSLSKDGSVGLLTQRQKIRDVKSRYNDLIPLWEYRIIAVDMDTGDLIHEFSMSPSTEKTIEFGASFLDDTGSKAIVHKYESWNSKFSEIDLQVWNIAKGINIGETQTVSTQNRESSTQIKASPLASDNDTLQLLYSRGASQIIVSKDNGEVLHHYRREGYDVDPANKGGDPRARTGFPLPHGRILLVVSGEYVDDSWRVFQQDNKEILGQQVDGRGIIQANPNGRIALLRKSNLYELFEIQE